MARLGVRHHQRALDLHPHRMRVRTYEATVEADEDPSVEAYPATVEDGLIVLHV